MLNINKKNYLLTKVKFEKNRYKIYYNVKCLSTFNSNPNNVIEFFSNLSNNENAYLKKVKIKKNIKNFFDILLNKYPKFKKLIKLFFKISIIVHMDNKIITTSKLDTLLDMFFNGYIKIDVNKNKTFATIEQGVDDLLIISNPGAWMVRKNPIIKKELISSIETTWTDLSNLGIKKHVLAELVLNSIIKGLNLSLQEDYNKDNPKADDIPGGGISAIMNFFKNNIIKYYIKNIHSELIDDNAILVRNLKNHEHLEDFLKDNNYLENYIWDYINIYDNNLSSAIDSLFYGTLYFLLQKKLIKTTKGKYYINEDNIEHGFSNINFPRLTEKPYIITPDKSNEFIRHKMGKKGSIKMRNIHYKGLNFLSNVPYRISSDMISYLFNLDDVQFNKLLGYEDVDTSMIRKYKKKKKSLFNKRLNLDKTDKQYDDEFYRLTMERDEVDDKLKKIHAQASKNDLAIRSLLFAITLINKPFYLDMFYDTRGRIYYGNSYISPQGNKIGRNLIEFYKGNIAKEKDLELFYNLGYDYYLTRKENLNNSPKNPLIILNDDEVKERRKKITFNDSLIWDEKCEEPLQYLNWYLNMKKIEMDKKRPIHYIMRYDATSSGIQHISMIIRDVKIAKDTNVLNTSTYGNDYYWNVANHAEKNISNLTHGVGLNKILKIGVDRKTVKKSSMSRSYNATHISMANDIKKQFTYKKGGYIHSKTDVMLHDEELKNYVNIVINSIYEYSVPLNDLLLFFKNWARIFNFFDKELLWELPDVLGTGDKILINQKYVKVSNINKNVVFGGKRTSATFKIVTNEINKVKQRNTFAPNFIHSLDAYQLLLFTNAVTHNFKKKMNISVVHDCIGVSVKNCWKSQRIMHDTYKKMYQNHNYINELYNTFINTLKKDKNYGNTFEIIGDNFRENKYIVLYKYNKNDLYFLKSAAWHDEKGLVKELPHISIMDDKEWKNYFKDDPTYIFSFTP